MCNHESYGMVLNPARDFFRPLGFGTATTRSLRTGLRQHTFTAVYNADCTPKSAQYNQGHQCSTSGTTPSVLLGRAERKHADMMDNGEASLCISTYL